jgi:hypothetical protein
MNGWGLFEATRIWAGGVPTTDFLGVDLGQARDPTAIVIVRKVDNPGPEDFRSMLLAEPPTRTYAVGSVEASRTSPTGRGRSGVTRSARLNTTSSNERKN